MTANGISQRDFTRSIEMKRRQLIEKHDNCLNCVHELERRLHIVKPWVAGSEEWLAARKKVEHRDYRRALDALEGLVVSRLFELSKMNMSQMGMPFAMSVGALLITFFRI